MGKWFKCGVAKFTQNWVNQKLLKMEIQKMQMTAVHLQWTESWWWVMGYEGGPRAASSFTPYHRNKTTLKHLSFSQGTNRFPIYCAICDAFILSNSKLKPYSSLAWFVYFMVQLRGFFANQYLRWILKRLYISEKRQFFPVYAEHPSPCNKILSRGLSREPEKDERG